jgi:hypothetical protein
MVCGLWLASAAASNHSGAVVQILFVSVDLFYFSQKGSTNMESCICCGMPN